MPISSRLSGSRDASGATASEPSATAVGVMQRKTRPSAEQPAAAPAVAPAAAPPAVSVPAAAAPAAAPGAVAPTSAPIKQGEEKLKEWRAAAKRSVLLSKLDKEGINYVFRSTKLYVTEVGEIIYTQGDIALDLYVAQSGRYRATVLSADGETPQLLREFGPGDGFGSFELLRSDTKRQTTLTVLEAGAIWVVPKKVFDSKLRMAPAPAPSLMEKVRCVRAFSGLAPEQHILLARAAKTVILDKGQALYNPGDAACDLYALMEGQVKVVADGDDEQKQTINSSDHRGYCLATPDAFFPEEHMRVHHSHVSAWAGSATLLKFAVDDIEALLGFVLQNEALKAFHLRMLTSVHVAKDVPLLHGMPEEQLDWLCASLVLERPFSRGERVVDEGDNDDKLYVVLHGRASVTTQEFGEAVVLESGQYFGELALTGRRRKRTTAVSCKGPAPLGVLSLSYSMIKNNPELEKWTKALDAAVTKTMPLTAAERPSKGPVAKTAGPKGNQLHDAAVGGQKRNAVHRRSVNDMFLDAQKATALAAEKAARASLLTQGSKSKAASQDKSGTQEAKQSNPNLGGLAAAARLKKDKTNGKSKAPPDKLSTQRRRRSFVEMIGFGSVEPARPTTTESAQASDDSSQPPTATACAEAATLNANKPQTVRANTPSLMRRMSVSLGLENLFSSNADKELMNEKSEEHI